jgi:medium-chain acyl-[acyl-carrier-protein] hydrolase
MSRSSFGLGAPFVPSLRSGDGAGAGLAQGSVDLVAHSRPVRPRRRLVCFPYAGGGASIYRRWAEELADDVELLAVQLPGRENRLLEPPMQQLTHAAERTLFRLKLLPPLPTVFFGHSMGALLAYEAALHMPRWLGLAQLVVSGRAAPHLPAVAPPVAGLDDGGTPAEVLQQPELMQLLLPMLRADFGMVDNYRPAPRSGPLSCPVLAVYGREDPATSAASMQAWSGTTCGGFEMQALSGGHFFLHEHRSRLVAAMGMAAALR